MQFALDVNALIQGGVLALLLYIAKLLVGMARWQAETTVILTGAKGDNGLLGTVKELRQRSHAHGEEIHGLKGRVALVEHEVADLRGAA